ncbi:MAG: hypothetical protein JSR79_04300 [Proteobacteria bacterium]|nr:hypothetical protein [Pseudomonadota bacterium]
MNVTRIAAIAAAAVLVAGLAVPGATATKRAVLPPPLLPLSEKDMYSTKETGCETSVGQGKDTFIFLIGESMILRTAPGPKGLQVCRPPNVYDFDDTGKSVVCGDRRLSLKHVGKAVSHPEADSSEGSGILTMSDGTNSRQVKVSWGTAC